jgi:dienelactone hydrolase
MQQSMEQINQLISNEVDSGTLPNRIVLGGFSQGGTMSLLTGLTSERKVAGVISLSGWLPSRNKFTTVSVPHLPAVRLLLIFLFDCSWPPPTPRPFLCLWVMAQPILLSILSFHKFLPNS